MKITKYIVFHSTREANVAGSDESITLYLIHGVLKQTAIVFSKNIIWKCRHFFLCI